MPHSFTLCILRAINYEKIKLIHYAHKLKEAGIKYRPRTSNNFLDICFANRVLEMPHIALDELKLSFFSACVVFEQTYTNVPENISGYVTFLGCLMSNEKGKDLALMSKCHVLRNY